MFFSPCLTWHLCSNKVENNLKYIQIFSAASSDIGNLLFFSCENFALHSKSFFPSSRQVAKCKNYSSRRANAFKPYKTRFMIKFKFKKFHRLLYSFNLVWASSNAVIYWLCASLRFIWFIQFQDKVVTWLLLRVFLVDKFYWISREVYWRVYCFLCILLSSNFRWQESGARDKLYSWFEIHCLV